MDKYEVLEIQGLLMDEVKNTIHSFIRENLQTDKYSTAYAASMEIVERVHQVDMSLLKKYICSLA